MKTRNYRPFYRLLNEHAKVSAVPVDELKEQLVSEMSEGRTTSVAELTDTEYAALCGALESRLSDNADRDKWRKRVLAAFCEYYSLMGYYKDSTPKERIEKAKGEAIKAKCEIRADNRRAAFNDIPVSELQALYYGKCRQNKVLRAVNRQFGDDLKEDAK